MRRIAAYPGSFDPITKGHLGVLFDSLGVFDEIHIVVATNADKADRLFTPEEAAALTREAVLADGRFEGLLDGERPRLRIVVHGGFLVDYCRDVGALHMIRGLRSVTDFDYEFTLNGTNLRLAPEIRTVFFMAPEEFMFVSSRMAKGIARGGKDVSWLLPPVVEATVMRKLGR